METLKLRPGRFARDQALRFGLKAQTDSGLEFLGRTQVSVVGGNLYLV